MSTTIDTKVVQMKFDNQQFQTATGQTMSTLDRLRNALKFNGAKSGVDEVGESATTASGKFSVLAGAAAVALGNIATKAAATGASVVKSLTLQPAIDGFNEYELKMNSIQTIMSNTASKGTKMSDITRTLNDLNTYADKTIYNFAEMTRNIGTFTAAGVDLDTSAKAIKGIANLAAMSGSNSQQASTAMYQLSQALATGTVKLMDWNSVVNAGMGGEKFQEALKQTAREHGVAVDQIIKKNGSFRDSLQEGWLTAEIMTDTLNKFTVEGATKYAEAQMKAGKMTQEQADALIKEAQAAEDAATKVKTFTQLIDTLREALGSGWAQTWEILIGNFDEAEALFTDISDVLSNAINKSAQARNELLQGWKDAGGRQDLIDGLKNAFDALVSVVKPIHDAFANIFPAPTVQQLVNATKAFKNFTEGLKLTEKQSENLRKTFEGVFGVIRIFVNIVKSIASVIGAALSWVGGLIAGLLGITGPVGDVIGDLAKGTDSMADFIAKASTKFSFPGFKAFDDFSNGLTKTLGKVKDAIKPVIDDIKDGFKNMSTAIGESFDKKGFEPLFQLVSAIEGVGVAAMFKKIGDAIDGIATPIKALSGVGDGVKNVLGGVRDTLKSYQDMLNAKKLLYIAGAIGILAASLVAMSTIKPGNMAVALAGMAGLMTELSKFIENFPGSNMGFLKTIKTIPLMITIAISMGILAGALKKIGSLSVGQVIKGIVGLKTCMKELTKAVEEIGNSGGLKAMKGAGQLIVLAIAVRILASSVKALGAIRWQNLVKGLAGLKVILMSLQSFIKGMQGKDMSGMMKVAAATVVLAVGIRILAGAVQQMGNMNWKSLAKGLAGLAGILGELWLFMKLMSGMDTSGMLTSAAAILIVSAGVKILSDAISKLSGLDWGGIAKGLVGIGGALAAVVIASKLMTGSGTGAVGLVVAAQAVAMLVPPFMALSQLDWGEIVRGLVGLGGALAELAIASNLMSGKGAVGLILAATALAILAPPLALLGSMDWGSIVKAFVALGGSIAIFAAAAALLSPLVGPMFLLAAAMAALGAAMVLIGGGLLAAGLGLQAIATAFGMFATMGSQALEGITNVLKTIGEAAANFIKNLINGLVTTLPENIATFCQGLAQQAPVIVESLLTMAQQCLDSLKTHIGPMLQSLLDIIGNFLMTLGDWIIQNAQPLADKGIQAVIAVIEGMANAIQNYGPQLNAAVYDLLWAILGMIVNFLTGGAVTLKGKGSDMAKGAVNGFASKIHGLWEKAKDAATKVIKAFKDLPKKLLKKGKEALQGFIDGLVSKAKHLYDQAKKIADHVHTTIKKAFQVGSPSRTMFRIAQWLPIGFANGLADKAPVVYSQVESIADKINDAFTDTALDSDLNPTITPVLDLSNVESGANGIQSMLDRTNAAIGISGLNAANVNLQNGNTAENASINKLTDAVKTLINNPDRPIINVYGSENQDVDALADAVSDRIVAVSRRKAAMV